MEPLSLDITLNTLSSVEAVTLALAINVVRSASSVSAERGILNNFSPLPLKEPVCTFTSPVWIFTSPKKVEPLSIEVTINPFSESTEAVTLPLTNIFEVSDTNASIDCCASVESAEKGMSNKFSPLPLKEPL